MKTLNKKQTTTGALKTDDKTVKQERKGKELKEKAQAKKP